MRDLNTLEDALRRIYAIAHGEVVMESAARARGRCVEIAREALRVNPDPVQSCSICGEPTNSKVHDPCETCCQIINDEQRREG